MIKPKPNPNPMIRKVYLAIKTAKIQNAGTNSQPVLILAQENRDLLHHTFQIEGGLKEGETAFLTIDVSDKNLVFEYQYARLGIRGADAWLPEYAFIWVEKEPQYEEDSTIQPVGFKTYAGQNLSTDENEGALSIPLPRAYYSGFFAEIQHVLIIVKTRDRANAGTNSPVKLRMHSKNGIVLDIPISGPDTTQTGMTYMDIPSIKEPFRFKDLERIEISIEGEDSWMPEQLFVFGYQENEYAEQKGMMPLVYIPDWKGGGLPNLSTDPKEGEATIRLYQAYL